MMNRTYKINTNTFDYEILYISYIKYYTIITLTPRLESNNHFNLRSQYLYFLQ